MVLPLHELGSLRLFIFYTLKGPDLQPQINDLKSQVREFKKTSNFGIAFFKALVFYVVLNPQSPIRNAKDLFVL